MKVRITFALLILLLLSACASTNSGKPSEYGYLILSGSMVNREARVDGNLVGVDPAEDTQRVRLKAGNHVLELRSKNWVQNEDFTIEAGEKTVIHLP
ncbi:MAG: hypothetical protein GXY81_08500 [Candidatus Cloacimonetes bacterium]|nr:hypothetical protein [Candidatus Cloacimonadota bacterium]